MVPPSSHRVSRVRWYSGYSRMPSASLTGFSPSMIGFPTPFSSHTAIPYAVLTPKVLLPSVWPLPISLATTFGISFDFSSSPYLDVSVQAVPHIHLWIQCMLHGHDSMWVSPFRNLRIKDCLHLPAAFRSLPRLSSAPSAKAFALRPF